VLDQKVNTAEQIANLALLGNVQSLVYWSGTEYAPSPGSAWCFSTLDATSSSSASQRLERVFGIEIETCARCGARLKIVASIEEPGVIARILAHRDRASGRLQSQPALPAARAPPVRSAV